MKKIVINKQHGGFGLSALAVKKYLELNGQECYFFKTNQETIDLVPITLEEAGETAFWTVFTVPDPEKELNATTSWDKMSPEERENFERTWAALSFYSGDLERDDEKLVQVVEQLGEKANTAFSNLAVISIPDDVDWIVQEYDGMEWIAEKHRTWD